jgi:hypothetical protein
MFPSTYIVTYRLFDSTQRQTVLATPKLARKFARYLASRGATDVVILPAATIKESSL